MSHSTNSILVTGGAGFIGSNFVLHLLQASDVQVWNLDLLTYAGGLHNLDGVAEGNRYRFFKGDICDGTLVAEILRTLRPRAVVNIAAETHVDRSIASSRNFVTTNVVGTHTLLETAKDYYRALAPEDKEHFRFLQVSTDEVYGSLGPVDPPFHERTPFAPNSPYAASKAAADHFVRAYHHTHGLPTILTHCSNNYGPRQFPEKLIPLAILNCLKGSRLPIYGDGKNIRDWLFVNDHCEALMAALERGEPGGSYNIGGSQEKTNLEVVEAVCRLMDEFAPRQGGPHLELLQFVPDRPGHDRRYSVDSQKATKELGWCPRHSFEDALRNTVQWYVENFKWADGEAAGSYQEWIRQQYGVISGS